MRNLWDFFHKNTDNFHEKISDVEPDTNSAGTDHQLLRVWALLVFCFLLLFWQNDLIENSHAFLLEVSWKGEVGTPSVLVQ